MTIRKASAIDSELAVPLLDAYRQFYRLESDLDGARRFLRDRFDNGDSAIFLAFVDSKAAGFAQLYPAFSSGAMARICVLNDLYVSPDGRRRGVASALLTGAADHARRDGAKYLRLSTELTNTAAQTLYEKTGWRRGIAAFTGLICDTVVSLLPAPKARAESSAA